MSLIANDLRRQFRGAVQTDVSLRDISRWRIGGRADVLISPRSINELSEMRAWIQERELQSLVIGATSNLLFSDAGLRAIAIQIGRELSSTSIEERAVIAGPGVWVPGLARTVMLAGLTGIEHTCGIPGTLGGLVCMNGGSQRKGIGDHVSWVRSVDAAGTQILRQRADCGFAYRTSAFQLNNEVICEVGLTLEVTASQNAQRREMLEILGDRRRKFPNKMPNCGSVFVSNPAMYADYGPPGRVIENAGLKGLRMGDAQVSPLHANFIINLGNATAKDTLALIRHVRNKAYEATGYLMESEVRFVSPDGSILPTHNVEP